MEKIKELLLSLINEYLKIGELEKALEFAHKLKEDRGYALVREAFVIYMQRDDVSLYIKERVMKRALSVPNPEKIVEALIEECFVGDEVRVEFMTLTYYPITPEFKNNLVRRFLKRGEIKYAAEVAEKGGVESGVIEELIVESFKKERRRRICDWYAMNKLGVSRETLEEIKAKASRPIK
ncbi:MAG: hypothetical protein Q7U36_01880 [bacterium]|nr:hypothetical protein [bacterium]